MKTLTTALAGALALPLAALGQPGPAPDPMIRADATEQVSEHVHVILDEGVPFVPNVVFVVGETGVLVVDTGMGDENGAIVLAEAERLAPGRAIFIASTHYHPEHDLGAGAFPESATVIRSTDQRDEIAAIGEQTIAQFSGFSPRVAELLDGVAHREADVVFEDEHRLDLGGVEAVLMAMGANHTEGDTAIHVPADDVLISGDLAMRRPPAFASPSSSLAQWLTSLERYAALEPATLVPAHGPLGEGTGFIESYQAYLTDVRDAVVARKAEGLSEDDAVAAAMEDLAEAYPEAGGRMAGAARAAYREAG